MMILLPHLLAGLAACPQKREKETGRLKGRQKVGCNIYQHPAQSEKSHEKENNLGRQRGIQPEKQPECRFTIQHREDKQEKTNWATNTKINRRGPRTKTNANKQPECYTPSDTKGDKKAKNRETRSRAHTISNTKGERKGDMRQPDTANTQISKPE